MIEFGSRRIGKDEPPKWVKNQFLISESCPHTFFPRDRYSLFIPDLFYINQLSKDHFKELDEFGVDPGSEEMRKSGCGVACLYIAVQTLKSDEAGQLCPTVGSLALQLLYFHRNDLVDGTLGIVKAGTPVFNSIKGWYHDALVYYASREVGLGAYRKTSLTLQDIICELQDMRDNDRLGVAIVSVDNKHWREENEPPSFTTHMVLMHGFRTNEDALVERILVTDPYTHREPKLNRWTEVDDRVSKSVVGNAIFIYKEGII